MITFISNFTSKLNIYPVDSDIFRQRAEAVKGRGPESVRRGSIDTKKAPTPEFTAQAQPKTASSSYKYYIQEDAGTGFRIEPPRVSKQNGFEHSTSMIHPSAVAGLSLNKSAGSSSRNNPELRAQKSHESQSGEMSSSSLKKNEKAPTSRDSSMVKNHQPSSIFQKKFYQTVEC